MLSGGTSAGSAVMGRYITQRPPAKIQPSASGHSSHCVGAAVDADVGSPPRSVGRSVGVAVGRAVGATRGVGAAVGDSEGHGRSMRFRNSTCTAPTSRSTAPPVSIPAVPWAPAANSTQQSLLMSPSVSRELPNWSPTSSSGPLFFPVVMVLLCATPPTLSSETMNTAPRSPFASGAPIATSVSSGSILVRLTAKPNWIDGSLVSIPGSVGSMATAADAVPSPDRKRTYARPLSPLVP
mmetsp:Transcript_8750/g.29877  ORF Transcript_8750/g.29877 Transcript_8750/m.29877 type:complete len:238 (-) Transcript_8750:78-791(-)